MRSFLRYSFAWRVFDFRYVSVLRRNSLAGSNLDSTFKSAKCIGGWNRGCLGNVPAAGGITRVLPIYSNRLNTFEPIARDIAESLETFRRWLLAKDARRVRSWKFDGSLSSIREADRAEDRHRGVLEVAGIGFHAGDSNFGIGEGSNRDAHRFLNSWPVHDSGWVQLLLDRFPLSRIARCRSEAIISAASKTRTVNGLEGLKLLGD